MNVQTVTNDYSYMLINHNPGFHAGVKGVSEQNVLAPCNYYSNTDSPPQQYSVISFLENFVNIV